MRGASPYSYSASASTSDTCIASPVSSMRPVMVSRPARIGCASRNAIISGVLPDWALRRMASPSRTSSVTREAPHSSRADSASVVSTACRSKAERLMVLSTLAVGLELQGFFEIARFCLNLPEQPRVLDSDEGLVAERLGLGDFLRAEGVG